MSDRAAILLLALLLDALAGDPPGAYHPVAWMGEAIGAAQRAVRRYAPEAGSGFLLLAGGTIALGGMTVSGAVGWLLSRAFGRLPRLPGWLAMALVLKSTFALRGLGQAAGEVRAALEAGDLEEARRLVGWHLVSRETSSLTASQVAAATIESVAENASDGVIAPLFYFALFGLPGALAYRFANTCDAMLGYRDAAREWLGKVPARLDDLLNLIPARLTALALGLACVITGEGLKGAFAVWRRDHGRTASPNAGHPMSAVAGALGVELEKVGVYRLGEGGRPPGPDDIRRAVNLMRWAAFLAVGGMILCAGGTSGRLRGGGRKGG